MKRVKILMILSIFFVFPSFVNAQTEEFIKDMDLNMRISLLYMEMTGRPAFEGINEFTMGNSGMVTRTLYNRDVKDFFEEVNYPLDDSYVRPSQFFITTKSNNITGGVTICSAVAPVSFFEEREIVEGLEFGFYEKDPYPTILALHQNREDMDFGYSYGNYYESFKVKIDAQKISGENINITMNNVSEKNKKLYDINDNERQVIEFNIDKKDTPELEIDSKTNDGSIIRIKRISVYGLRDEKKVSKISMTPEEYTVKVGKSKLLYPKIEPDTAVNKKVTYKSSDPSTVRVFSNGKVQGLKPGVATITATTDDGGFTADSVITVE